MDDEEFKLSSDDTMRRLRYIAQSPGELKWRLELVATLNDMRAEQRLAVRTILQSQKNLQEKLAELGPIKLEKTIDRRIKAHEEATESIKYRAGWKTVRSHLITAFVTIAVAIVIYKLTGK